MQTDFPTAWHLFPIWGLHILYEDALAHFFGLLTRSPDSTLRGPLRRREQENGWVGGGCEVR